MSLVTFQRLIQPSVNFLSGHTWSPPPFWNFYYWCYDDFVWVLLRIKFVHTNLNKGTYVTQNIDQYTVRRKPFKKNKWSQTKH